MSVWQKQKVRKVVQLIYLRLRKYEIVSDPLFAFDSKTVIVTILQIVFLIISSPKILFLNPNTQYFT